MAGNESLVARIGRFNACSCRHCGSAWRGGLVDEAQGRVAIEDDAALPFTVVVPDGVGSTLEAFDDPYKPLVVLLPKALHAPADERAAGAQRVCIVAAANGIPTARIRRLYFLGGRLAVFSHRVLACSRRLCALVRGGFHL